MSDENDKKKKTPQERVAEAIAEAQADEAMEKISEMTDEEIAKELADDGVDMEEEHRHMAEMLKKHGIDVDAPQEKKEEKKGAEVVAIDAAKAKRGSSNWVWYAVAAGVVAVVAWQWAKRGIEPDVPVASPLDAAVEAAAAPLPAVTPSAPPPAAPTTPASAADAGACRPIAWKDGGLFGAVTSFDGVVRHGEGFDANNRRETFFTIVVDEPVCAQDGTPVRQMQIFEDADPDTRDSGLDLRTFFGRHVTLEGEPMAEHTAHHHTPVLVAVKKVRTR